MVEIEEGYRPGLIGDLAALHGLYYAREWQFGPFFEARVAREAAEFIVRYDPQHDRIWSARSPSGRTLGTITIDGGEPDAALSGAHLRWFVMADEARGTGLGKRLMAAAMDFVAASDFERVYLWTFAGLDAARALYERHGFELVEEVPDDQWGTPVTGQRFEKLLRG